MSSPLSEDNRTLALQSQKPFLSVFDGNFGIRKESITAWRKIEASHRSPCHLQIYHVGSQIPLILEGPEMEAMLEWLNSQGNSLSIQKDDAPSF